MIILYCWPNNCVLRHSTMGDPWRKASVVFHNRGFSNRYTRIFTQVAFWLRTSFLAAVKSRFKVRCNVSLEIINLNKNTSTKFGNVCKSRIEKGSLVSAKLQRQFQHWSWLNQWDIRRGCAFHKLVATFGTESPDSCTLVYDYTAKAYAGPEIGFW